jgi:hypothetical protein
MRDQYVVRIAFSDLPTAVSDEICYAIAIAGNQRRPIPTTRASVRATPVRFATAVVIGQCMAVSEGAQR